MIKIARPGGVKAIAAENIVLRQQLITLSRRYKRSPKLTASDRILLGLLGSWIKPKRLSATGYGEFQPITSNMTKAGKQKNRRVEIVILPKTTKDD